MHLPAEPGGAEEIDHQKALDKSRPRDFRGEVVMAFKGIPDAPDVELRRADEGRFFAQPTL